MSAEDGVLRDLLKPGARTKALWPGALDLICPLQALGGGEAVTAGGLSAAAWSRNHFLDGPVCDGCGQPSFGKDMFSDRGVFRFRTQVRFPVPEASRRG